MKLSEFISKFRKNIEINEKDVKKESILKIDENQKIKKEIEEIHRKSESFSHLIDKKDEELNREYEEELKRIDNELNSFKLELDFLEKGLDEDEKSDK